MISMRILNHSSCFRFFLLFSITIFLTPLNDHRTALVSAAVHWNFGPNTPDPGEPANNDYPTDDRVISNAFVRPRRDQTVVFIDVVGGVGGSRSEPYDYCEWSKKSSIYDAFPSLIFYRGSARWYDAFIARLMKKFLEAAEGTVFLISEYPYGPPDDTSIMCSFWWSFAFPALKENRRVNRIKLVNPQNYGETRLYWRRGGNDPDPNNLYPQNDGPGGNRLRGGRGFGTNLNFLGGLGTLLTPTVVAPAALGAGSLLAPGGLLLHGLPGSVPGDGGSDDQSHEISPDVMDTLDQLPSDTYPPAVRGKTSMTQQDEMTGLPSFGVFRRRSRRGLFDSYAGPVCMDWSGIPSSQGADGKIIWGKRKFNSDPDAAINVNPPQGNLDHRFSPNDAVTVEITQYEPKFPSERLSDPTQPVSINPRLDIEVLDPAGQTSGKPLHSVEAPPGQLVDISPPVLYDTLHVATGVNHDDPISFQLGGGQRWDSTDTDAHKCGTSAWKDGKRRIVCSFQINEGSETEVPGNQPLTPGSQPLIPGSQPLIPETPSQSPTQDGEGDYEIQIQNSPTGDDSQTQFP